MKFLLVCPEQGSPQHLAIAIRSCLSGVKPLGLPELRISFSQLFQLLLMELVEHLGLEDRLDMPSNLHLLRPSDRTFTDSLFDGFSQLGTNRVWMLVWMFTARA